MSRSRAVLLSLSLSLVAGVTGCTGGSSGDAAIGPQPPAPVTVPPSFHPMPTPSGSAPASAGAWDTSKLPSPCRLITVAELSRVLGRDVGQAQRVESWPPFCAYNLSYTYGGIGPGVPSPDASTVANSEYFYVIDDSGETGKQDFERDREDKSAIQPVSGIGDAAYWVPGRTELQVLSGTTRVVTKFGVKKLPADARRMAIDLARIALPRAVPKK